jgi:hypothetical protein
VKPCASEGKLMAKIRIKGKIKDPVTMEYNGAKIMVFDDEITIREADSEKDILDAAKHALKLLKI